MLNSKATRWGCQGLVEILDQGKSSQETKWGTQIILEIDEKRLELLEFCLFLFALPFSFLVAGTEKK